MLGNFAIARGDREMAAAEYDLCLACDVTFAPSHNNLGVIAASEGRHPEAYAHFTRAADLRPAYADPRRNADALRDARVSELRYTLAPLRPVLRPEMG